MPSRRNHRLSMAITVLVLTGISILALLQWRSTPVVLADAPSTRVDCLSYAPFRRHGESPLDPDAHVPVDRLRADLRILRSRTDCVRTYSVDQGLGAVPAVAGELGMRVLLGVWIGRDAAQNRREIARALEIARAHAEHIEAIVVGNEVLLRREQTAADLAGLIATVRAATDIPVTYADVWEFWLQHRELANVVDFVTVHILPFWEDHPVAIDAAVGHVCATLTRMQQAFPQHEVLLGETGWPSAGRMRGPARPGPVEQARFVREWIAAADASGVRYNLIEAFDQPWKRALEGAMGGHWGIFDSAGQTKFAWRGPVVASAVGIGPAVLAGASCAILSLLLLLSLSRPVANDVQGRGRCIFAALAAGFVAGMLMPLQWEYLRLWNRGVLEWVGGTLFTFAGWAGLLLLIPLLAQTEVLPGFGDWSRRRHRMARTTGQPLITLWTWLRLGLLFGCALFVLLHVFDARYRGYGIVLFLPPAVSLLVLWLADVRVPADAPNERLLGMVILIGLPFLLWPELPFNTQALGFSSLAALMGASAVWVGHGRSGSLDQRSSPSRPSRAPNNPGSTA